MKHKSSSIDCKQESGALSVTRVLCLERGKMKLDEKAETGNTEFLAVGEASKAIGLLLLRA